MLNVLLSADFFQHYFFFQKFLRNTIKWFESRNVRPALGPNCLKLLLADNKSCLYARKDQVSIAMEKLEKKAY